MTGLTLLASGKVRELYELGDDLLMVASDRISTYDVVHPTPIPDKGRVLTALSVLWFDLTRDAIPNHLISATEGVPDEFRGRGLRVRRLEMLPVECVVRGYLSGSGWKDYQATGKVSGIELPAGLRESEQLPEPIFTPSTKADEGHDEAIDFEQAAELAGSRELAARLRDASLEVYGTIAAHARERGIILADTKFEFGLDADGTLTLGDEVCTPDSSRFWPADRYEVGRGQPSFDKQYVRDWASVHRLGQDAARARDPRRRGRADARALRDRVRAPVGRAVLRLAGAHGALRVRVLIRPKAGILDPQGQAVERALPALGFEGVSNVHVGRLIELDVDDPARVGEMCERLLANPLIEDFQIERPEGDRSSQTAGPDDLRG